MLPVTSDPSITPSQPSGSNKKPYLSPNPRLVVVLLLVAIAVMVFLWKPWQANIRADSRTVEVTGTATLKAEPDEYIFYPNYEFKNADQDAALMALTKKSDQIVAELKRLGVAEAKIKTNSSGYKSGIYLPIESSDGIATYSLSLTITITDKVLAQKVQNYLVTTTPTGALSPQAGFSTAKQKELESKARDTATKDARSKAEQSAANLGFKLDKVKSVTDGPGFGGPIPLYSRGAAEDTVTSAPSSQLTIQPGENDLSYSVTVVYFIK